MKLNRLKLERFKDRCCNNNNNADCYMNLTDDDDYEEEDENMKFIPIFIFRFSVILLRSRLKRSLLLCLSI